MLRPAGQASPFTRVCLRQCNPGVMTAELAATVNIKELSRRDRHNRTGKRIMTTTRKELIETAIQIGIITLLVLWCYQIAAPFIGPIVWGGIIAIGVHPLY